MLSSQEANSSKIKRQILDMKITKFCLLYAFEYRQCDVKVESYAGILDGIAIRISCKIIRCNSTPRKILLAVPPTYPSNLK